MRSSALLFSVLVLSVCSPAQSSGVPQGGTEQESSKIGPSAVWQPPADFITKAHAACDAANPPNYGQCLLDQMAKSGAPADAVTFARRLYKQSDGQVGIMTAFQKAGPVDMARVMYPLRANDNYGLLLVNGDPNLLDVDDLKKLDRSGLEKAEVYQLIKDRFPHVELFTGDRSGTNWPAPSATPGGGQQFIIGYPLRDGCRACRPLGLARFAWDFDAQGKFLKTVYIPTPPPRLIRPKPTEAHPPQAPTQTPQQ